MKTSKVLSALFIAILPCTAALAADTPTSAGAGGAAAAADQGPPPAEVLTKLHHANQMEIEAGKLAQEKGHSKEVKAYGKMLQRDHSAADKQVNALAKQLKVEFETMPDMKNAKLEAAKSATGPEFDKMFAAAMVEDHDKDIKEATTARDATSHPKLKKLLTALVPKLEKHKAAAQKIADKPAAADSASAPAAGVPTPGAMK